MLSLDLKVGTMAQEVEVLFIVDYPTRRYPDSGRKSNPYLEITVGPCGYPDMCNLC